MNDMYMTPPPANGMRTVNPRVSSTKSSASLAKANAVGPSWTRGEIEAPVGRKDMNGWQTAVYTPEQQKRLNVDAQGYKVTIPTLSNTELVQPIKIIPVDMPNDITPMPIDMVQLTPNPVDYQQIPRESNTVKRGIVNRRPNLGKNICKQ